MKPKIAICVSGKIRHYNLTTSDNHITNTDRFHSGLDKMFGEYDYDLYGHTWQDQALPVDLAKYKQVIQTEQSEIWDFVVDNFKRAPYNRIWKDKPEYIAAMHGNNMMQFLKDRSYEVYGQIWSNYKSMELARKNDTYTHYIRYRWDNIVAELTDAEFEYQHNIIRNFMHNRASGPHANASVLAPGSAIIGADYVEDRLFVFTEEFTKRVVDNGLEDIFDAVEFNNNTGCLLSSHELWYNYLLQNECRMIAAGIPFITSSDIPSIPIARPSRNWEI